MPIYTYRCSCSHLFEKEQPYFSKHPKCEKCGSKEVEKIITPPIVSRSKEIRTVGQQGEANYKRDKNKIQEENERKKELKKQS